MNHASRIVRGWGGLLGALLLAGAGVAAPDAKEPAEPAPLRERAKSFQRPDEVPAPADNASTAARVRIPSRNSIGNAESASSGIPIARSPLNVKATFTVEGGLPPFQGWAVVIDGISRARKRWRSARFSPLF